MNWVLQSQPESHARRANWWTRWLRMARNRVMIDGLEHLNIRWRFRAVVIAFGLPFFAYIVWNATQQAGIEKAHLRERTLSLANLFSSRLDDHVEQMDRILATAAHSVGPDIDDQASVMTLLHNMRSTVPASVSNIVVWTLSGRIIASLDPAATLRQINVVDRRYFMDVIERPGFTVEAPIVSRNSGQYIAMFARPVVNAQGRMIAVITMASRLSALITELDPNHRLGPDTVVRVVDKNGTIVARSIDPELWIGKQLGQLDRIKEAFEQGSGAREDTGVDGQALYLGFSAATKAPWMVYAGEPIEKAIAPISERLLTSLGVGISILVFVMLLAGRVASWTIRPLLRLAADTERLAAGDLTHRSAVVTGGEIANLAANFNRMAEALEERELALEKSQHHIRQIADHIPSLITYIDTDERYRFVNDYRSLWNNVTPAELIGKTVREIRGEDVYQKLAPLLRRVLAGEATTAEVSGSIGESAFHIRTEYVPDLDAAGKVLGLYAFTSDVTERRAAELRLVDSEKRLVTITDNMPAMICYIDRTRRFRFANRAFEKWFNRPLADVIGRPFEAFMAPEIVAQIEIQFARSMRGERSEYELEVPVSGHRPRWLRGSFIPDIDETTGAVRGVYSMHFNMTAAKEAEQRLTRLAQFDTLTGLPNRHQFNEKLARALSLTGEERKPMALMFLDIDHFKQVNDRFGHAGGDTLLKDFAQRLAQAVRPTDTVARLAGDEFVVLLERLHSDDEPQFIARKIIAAVQKFFTVDESLVQVTSSIGIAMRLSEHETPSLLMRRADEALYEAKRSGRNTFRMAC